MKLSERSQLLMCTYIYAPLALPGTPPVGQPSSGWQQRERSGRLGEQHQWRILLSSTSVKLVAEKLW